MFWFGIASRNSFTRRARHISVYIQPGSDRWGVVIRLATMRRSCCNLSAAVLLRLAVDTQAFGHGAGRGEGAPWSLQPLPQGRAQVGVPLRMRGRTLLYNVRLISTWQSRESSRRAFNSTLEQRAPGLTFCPPCSQGLDPADSPGEEHIDLFDAAAWGVLAIDKSGRDSCEPVFVALSCSPCTGRVSLTTVNIQRTAKQSRKL